ncbi:hypothetical protein JCM19046_1994 [Bacillus sp. JCM 19046]|nr:hypothetical protein JCM19045_4543 [Bacillus sp. JCM 19045]GAF17477.1 hypothetical protein JCM19046_1994 [Bacillus sp. JCM 19046]
MFSVTSILRVTAKDLYHHIVSIVSISLLVAILCIPFFLFLPWQLAILFLLLIGGPVWLAAATSMEAVLTNKKVILINVFLKGFFAHYLKGVGLAFFFGGFVFILAASWWHWSIEQSYVAFAIACFQTYFSGMVLLSQLYTVPLLIKYQLNLPKAMGASVKLLLKYPLYTIGCFIQLVLFAGLLAFTIVGNALLLPGVVALFLSRMTSAAVSRSDFFVTSELQDEHTIKAS